MKVSSIKRAVMLACLPVLVGAGPPGADVSVTVTGLRNVRGQVLACLTTAKRGFPDCTRDPAARHLIMPAAEGMTLDFGPVPPGVYAVSLLHDENGNGKADMMLMIPREGFGFSRDAPVRFGPPSFKDAAFTVAAQPVQQTIRMRYVF
ncbi:MAG: DUF2141 domain-containing protein [Novosphingobium sp.]